MMKAANLQHYMDTTDGEPLASFLSVLVREMGVGGKGTAVWGNGGWREKGCSLGAQPLSSKRAGEGELV